MPPWPRKTKEKGRFVQHCPVRPFSLPSLTRSQNSKGLATHLLVGSVTCETKELFAARPQVVAVDINDLAPSNSTWKSPGSKLPLYIIAVKICVTGSCYSRVARDHQNHQGAWHERWLSGPTPRPRNLFTRVARCSHMLISYHYSLLWLSVFKHSILPPSLLLNPWTYLKKCISQVNWCEGKKRSIFCLQKDPDACCGVLIVNPFPLSQTSYSALESFGYL